VGVTVCGTPLVGLRGIKGAEEGTEDAGGLIRTCAGWEVLLVGAVDWREDVLRVGMVLGLNEKPGSAKDAGGCAFLEAGL
jgi:hypothetical protein